MIKIKVEETTGYQGLYAFQIYMRIMYGLRVLSDFSSATTIRELWRLFFAMGDEGRKDTFKLAVAMADLDEREYKCLLAMCRIDDDDSPARGTKLSSVNNLSAETAYSAMVMALEHIHQSAKSLGDELFF